MHAACNHVGRHWVHIVVDARGKVLANTWSAVTVGGVFHWQAVSNIGTGEGITRSHVAMLSGTIWLFPDPH